MRRKGYWKEYYAKNREKKLEGVKQCYIRNPENKLKYQKQYYIDNREKLLEQSRLYNKMYRLYNKKYNRENTLNIREAHRIYQRQRRKTDIKCNTNDKMSLSIYSSLKGNKAGRHWETLVGYTVNELIKRLKSTMPKGYSWNDILKGKLHIDHILPKRLFQFNKPEDNEFKQCWSLYNLQLLPVKENLIKHDSINNPILLGLLLKEMA